MDYPKQKWQIILKFPASLFLNGKRGKSYPDIENIVLLCKLYKITINELLELDEGGIQEQIQNQNMIEDIKENDVETCIQKDADTTLLTNLCVSIEVLTLLVIVALSSQVPFLGMLVPIAVAIWGRKDKKEIKLIYVACIVGFIMGTYNTYVIINHYFCPNLGTFTIQPQ